MLSIQLDEHSSLSLSEQIYRLILREIEAQHILPGERMPSRRELAEQLKVSTTTVETVYEHLVDEGICESHPRSGLYVLGDRPVPTVKHVSAKPVRWDFGIGAMDPAQFPYSTWAKLMRIVLSEQSDELLRTGNPQGSAGLRIEIAKMVQRVRGIEVEPERIVLAAGTDILVAILITLLGRERLFAVEDPGYSRARRILIAGGARIAPIPLMDGAINVRELYQAGAGAAYVTPGRQFPTGQEMSMDCRKRLMRWAKETGAYILEDDYESEFSFSEKPLPPLTALDEDGRVVYINTFARTLAPGLRISYMILPETLRGRYLDLYSACSVPGFEQATLEKFMAGGYYERHIKRMRQIYRERLACLEAEINRLQLGELHKNRSGLFELLSVHSTKSAEQLTAIAADAGVKMTALSEYSVLPEQTAENRTVLLGLAGMDEAKIREGLEMLKKVWLDKA
ncbi:MAG: PLP-dependent aminotransferase family protein [Clostridia bacterium]|nr:PLP-dependent aminotransferase family protein [Clostridia bacterium]